MKGISWKLLATLLISVSVMTVSVYAVQIIIDRTEIDNDDIAAAINAGDLFGYQIEAIGDLDGNGVIDLATIKFSDDSNEANVGSIVILFMNNDGTVSSTNEIIMYGTANGLNGCIANDSTNRDTGSLEQLAFVGDLDGDGEPTLALGANSNDHDVDGAGGNGVQANTGAVYMLELNSDGTVDNCVLITEDNGGFAPADGVYRQDATVANFGWPVIATDLNGDGQNELIVGATSEDDDYTDLWVLFLNTDGTVSSHPATPVSGLTIGMDSEEYIDDGASISGTKIVVSNQNDGDGGGSVFIVNLSSTGAFVSTTEIAGSSIAGVANDEFFGSGVTPLGDIDGDGVNDILVGNEAGDDTNTLSGEVHILYLNSDDTVKESQKISNETENIRTGISPYAASDLFGHGMTLWKDEGSQIVVAISAHQDDSGAENESGAIHLYTINVTAPRGTGSGNDDLSRPTFGIDPHTFVQRVDSGLVINGEPFTVDDNFFTHIPMQNMTVGQVQNFTATVYAPHQLYVLEFLFGIPEVGKWNEAESSLALYFDPTGELIEVEPKNADDIIANFDVLKYSYGKTKCVPDDNAEPCDRISIEFVFNEAPLGKVLALQAIDLTRRSTILYFNDGLDIQGDSLNPPVLKEIYSSIKGKATQTIERIDKANDIWKTLDEDEQVILYRQNLEGTFIPIERKLYERHTDADTNVMTRQHSEFAGIMANERDRALEIFDSSSIQGMLDPSFSLDYTSKIDRMDRIAEILLEQQRLAESILNDPNFKWG